MSLQQKIVEIRSMIPSLVKRAYSEEVSYDFIKIDDIFQYLTPAMNRFGVNLDIVKENATKKDDLGNPIYVQYLAQNQLWMYEADLTLRWINADQPDDMDERTIHAIGTHEMPEKAKGSAWTYALKYYLLDKFCIDQGGEDPDMRSFPVTPGTDGMDEETYSYEEREERTDENEREYQETGMDDDGFKELGAEAADVPFEENLQEPQAEPNQEFPQNRMTEDRAASTRPEPKPAARREKESKPSSKSQTPPASRQIRPESGRPVVLPESAGPQEDDGNMTVEEACQVVCSCGVHRGTALGELAKQGQDGLETLDWIAHCYRGNNKQMIQAARLLIGQALAA